MRCAIRVVFNGDIVCQAVVKPNERIVVGRSIDADLALGMDPTLSRLHFEVLGTSAGFVARDLGSSNGVITKGRRITETLLEHGQLLRAGSTDFIIHLLADTDRRFVPLPLPGLARAKPTDSDQSTAWGMQIG